MDDARDGAGGAAFHVGDGARDRAGGGHAAEERRHEVGDALGHQLLVGVVPVADHAVGHARAQQRFNGAQQRQRDDGHQQKARRFPAEIGQREGGQRRRNAAKAAANGFHRQLKHADHGGGQHQRHDGAWHGAQLAGEGQAGAQRGHPALPGHHDRKRCRGHAQRPGVQGVQMRPQRPQNAEEIARHLGDVQAQEILHLRQPDQHRDAIGEADDDRHGDEAHQRAQLEQPHQKKQHARERGGNDQVAHAVALDDAVDDDDERARRPANLHPAAAEQRDQKARNDGREQPRLRLEPRRNRKRHGQRQGDHAHREAGGQVFPEPLTAVALSRAY